MPSSDYLVWIDLEMTGLRPDTDVIIEMATIVTDIDLNVVAEGPVIAIHQPAEVMAAMDEWNKRTHGASGLIERVRTSGYTMASAEKRTLESLTALVEPGSSPMCGNSICQDRRFLARHMPALEKFFHYRNLDVSTLKELARRWAPELIPGFSKRGSTWRSPTSRNRFASSRTTASTARAGIRPHVNGELPDFADVVAAAARLGPHVIRTPVMRSSAFDARVGAQVFFKCENLQVGGAFKYRGAMNVLLQLDPKRTPRVITHSSGNHGNALALAARARGMAAIVVIPRDSSRSKIAAIEAAGARIEFCDPGLPAREQRLAEILATESARSCIPSTMRGSLRGREPLRWNYWRRFLRSMW
jgi:oligoribonuclease